MRAVFIAFNQVLTDEVLSAIGQLGLQGYTRWPDALGSGSRGGEPHLGTHTWPALNSAMLVMAEDTTAAQLMQRLKKLDERSPQQGLRAFMWTVENTI